VGGGKEEEGGGWREISKEHQNSQTSEKILAAIFELTDPSQAKNPYGLLVTSTWP
jgi:hypothetical protein